MTRNEAFANLLPEPRDPTGVRGLLARAVIGLGNIHRRVLAAYFAVIGAEAAYWITGLLARLLYRLLEPIRAISEGQCRAALRGRIEDQEIARVAQRAFVHRVWSIADLMLAERLLHPNTYHRYCEPIPPRERARMLDAQRRGQPAIFLTGYYGSFDLLPLFLGYNGIRAGVVYRRHANPGFDAYRRRIRARGGSELIPVEQAANRLGEILDGGGTVAIVADHHADRRGLPTSFLGIPTMAMRTVGLLAWRYQADIVVAGIRRVADAFRFRLIVADVIYHAEWVQADDPVAYVTERYLRGLEALILGDPSQYLWGYARWGKEFALRLVTDELGTPTAADPTRR